MRRLASLVLASCAALSSCTCGEDPTVDPPGRDASTPRCTTADDCRLGQVCLDGVCQASPDAGEAPDAASGCQSDSDCPDLRWACARSTGLCERVAGRCLSIADCDPGQFCELATNTCVAAQTDGGLPLCYDGETRSCGKSKVGECRFGLQTCQAEVWGACVGAVDPQQETCDGLDNDCDGEVDEDFLLATDPNNCGECGKRCAFPHAAALCQASKCAMGDCEAGWWDLDPGVPGCEYECTRVGAGLEVCDFKDNDCDGKADEGFDQDGDGLTSCAGDCDDADPAVRPGVPEICNAKDDDCDGALDEGFDQDGDGLTSCAGDCRDGDPEIRPGRTEICDGKDNDCSGLTDEGLGSWTCGVGACEVTMAKCVGGVAYICRPKDPGTETCNGIDDDCNGETDENLGTTHCGVGACGRTVAFCENGAPKVCTPGDPAPAETCDNGIDDNCNGKADEFPPCTCSLGTTQKCFTGVDGVGCTYVPATKSYTCKGACRQGSQTCVTVPGGTEWDACAGSVIPAAETCNAVDDDCDGQTDEGLGSTTCGSGECRVTVQNCVNGTPRTCLPNLSSPEMCDGKDNDCNGLTDDAIPDQRCGTGACARTAAGCTNGAVPACTPGAPGTETCNNVDDDCNGVTDNLTPSTETCGVGECQRTVARCASGSPQTCVAGAAAAETCDGKDNNCNGATDDVTPATETCGVGACQVTIDRCVGGLAQACVPDPPMAELCNAEDDDCNGSTDDGIASASCSTGRQGVCAAGHTVCQAGATACVQDVQAGSEICNNAKDDDCNGIVDDKPPCNCSTAIDNDADGHNECVDCNDMDGAIHPGVAEVCDGKDNDCDKLIDEGFDKDADLYTSCGTVPGAAGGLDPKRVDCDDNVASTNPGVGCDCAPNCNQLATPPVGTNAPDGKDNNCNGRTDETCNCSTADQDRDGVTGCQGDCNDADPTVKPGATELCDGKDNDCNTNSVENCDVGQTCNWPNAGTDVCKDRYLCARNISTGAYTCGSFCNYSLAGAGIGDGCRAGESCSSSLVFADNDNLCVASGTSGTKAAGDGCKKDNECKSNWCLGTPGVFCADFCGNDKEYCSATTACYVDLVPSSDPTKPYYEHYVGKCYISATGLVGTKRTGEACTTGKRPPDCRYGDHACVKGRCAEPCCKASDCPAGYFCNAGNADGLYKREAQLQSGGYIGTAMPVCTPRTSAGNRVAGAACNGNGDCLSQFCERTNLGGVCVDPCCNDASCANGTRCELVFVQRPGGDLLSMRTCVHVPVFQPANSGDPQLVWP